jgi:polyisoprenoid-binding protein YceI
LCLKLLVGVASTGGQPSLQPTKGEGRQLAFDQSQSSISFLVSTTLHPVTGNVRRFSGKVTLPSLSDPSQASVTLTVEASSLDTNNEGRDKKMREGCLEMSRFPTIRFKSLEIRNGSKSYSPGQAGKAEILGLLDLHGIQKKITVPVDYNYTGETLHVTGKAMVRMSDFQIPEPKFLLLRVKDEIEIVFDIRASST